MRVALGLIFGFSLVQTQQAGWTAHTSVLTWAMITHDQKPKLLRTNAPRGYMGAAMVVDDHLYMATVSGLWQQAIGPPHWSRIPTQSLASITTSLGYRIMPPIAAMLVAAQARPRIFAVVPAAQPRLGATPVFDPSVYTLNHGQQWRALPIPPGMTRTDFGGFQPHGSSVWSW